MKEKARQEPSSRSTGIVVFFLLFIVIVALALYTFMKSKGYEIKSIGALFSGASGSLSQEGEEAVREIKLNTEENAVFCISKDTIVVYTMNTVKGLNRSGEEIWSVPVTVNKPLLRANGDKILLADLGGKDIHILNKGRQEWEQTVDGNIIHADIGQSGQVMVVHEKEGYKGMVRVYDPEGDQVFERYIAKHFVLSVHMAPSGQQCVINGIDTSGIKVAPNLQFFDFRIDLQNPVAASTPVEDEVFLSVQYLNDHALIAVSNTSLLFYDKEGNLKWSKQFEEIYSAGVCLGKYPVVAYAQEGEGGLFAQARSRVDVLNSKGDVAGSFQLENEVQNIRVHTDMIAVNTGREVHFTNAKGDLKARYTSRSEVRDVHFLSKQQAVIVTKTGAVIFEIN